MASQSVRTIEDALAALSPADRRLLMSLPYRVGLYVSFSDTSGGWEAQEAEIQSLTNILREYSEDYCHSELAQGVLMETLRDRAQWPSWSQGIETVPREAQEAVRLLERNFSDKEVHDFKEILIDIALSVAMAFREGAAEREPPPFSVFDSLRKTILRLVGGSGKRDPFAHMNISASEKTALMRLCRGLGYQKA